jgi:hypothetical protein
VQTFRFAVQPGPAGLKACTSRHEEMKGAMVPDAWKLKSRQQTGKPIVSVEKPD